MKNKLWLLQIPVVLLLTFAFYIDELGVQGDLQNRFLRESVFPGLRRVSVLFTDFKYKIRGSTKPKNKVVIVAIDNVSLEMLGRWPWHRDTIAAVIASIFESGAKVVGLDLVFSEPDVRVPEHLAEVLRAQGKSELVDQAETDRFLQMEISKNADHLVLGWTTDLSCQPAYDEVEYCAVMDPEALATHPVGFEKFAYSEIRSPTGFDQSKTPFQSAVTFIANISEYNAVAKHAGYFNVWPDPDALVRRMSLVLTANGKFYTPLALEMAKIGLNEELQVTLDDRQKVKSIGFVKSGRNIPVTPQGVMEINYRGPGLTFEHVSVVDVISESDTIVGGKLDGRSKKELFKDAYVLVGPTALGIYDMRATPFDSNTAGVENHATILDNILSGDSLVNTSMSKGTIWVLLLMLLGALLWAYLSAQFGAVSGLVLFALLFICFGVLDTQLLFAKNLNWNTSFLYVEMFLIFVTTIALKYILEERDKRFIKGAFSKYVAPAVVDSILKDPKKLSVGGEKRELTILFSDIRGFTSFSERMDAKALSALLNEYLSVMTGIVFSTQGTLDKYIGDAVMAFWGAPLEQRNHASNALLAAVKMMNALDELRPKLKEKYGVQVEIGVGVNSGMVSVGNMGSEANFAYTVIGDMVNLASRLEGLTKTYSASILTTRFTFDDIAATGETFPAHRTLDFVKVKGKKNAVELIQVLERAGDAEGLKWFEEGRQLYAAQKWDEAIAKFKNAGERLAPSVEKLDGPSEMFIQRCEEFKGNPPGEAWDGSWEMHSK